MFLNYSRKGTLLLYYSWIISSQDFTYFTCNTDVTDCTYIHNLVTLSIYLYSVFSTFTERLIIVYEIFFNASLKLYPSTYYNHVTNVGIIEYTFTWHVQPIMVRVTRNPIIYILGTIAFVTLYVPPYTYS